MVVVHIAGAGPAGAIAALHARERGWTVNLHDPRVPSPGTLPPWPATYGSLVAELLGWALEFYSQPYSPRVHTHSAATLPHEYAMLNKTALRAAVERSGATITSDPLPQGVSPVLDCTGAPTAGRVYWQVAVGFFLPILPDATTDPIFMDWSTPTADPPSFLYAQPTDQGYLWEETVLATRAAPKDLLDELQARLESRLDEHMPGWREVEVKREVVSIPMGTRKRAFWRPVGSTYYFGAAGGMVNPATGYSVSPAFAQVDAMLDAIAGAGFSRRKALDAEAARFLRCVGAELISRADHATLRDFFAAFFRLDAQHQLGYLTGHSGRAVARTMWELRKQTGFAHPFLRPLWKNPRQVLLAAAGKVRKS